MTVNGIPSKASYEPSCGDRIEIRLPPPPPSELVPENIPLDIIYEDRVAVHEDRFAVEKGFQQRIAELGYTLSDEQLTDAVAALKALADKKPYLLKANRSGSGDGGGSGKAPNPDTFEAKQAAYLKDMTTTGGRVAVK